MSAAYDPKTYDLRNAVPYLMARVRTALIAQVESELAPFGIKAPEYFVLAALANELADTASGMCSFIAHDPGAMTRKIDALEQKGLVKRVRRAGDRRAITLELTPEGRSIYPKVMSAALDVVNRFLSGFTRSEVRELEEMLKRMLVNGESAPAGERSVKEARR
jgi:DNA-binding MarR family transcriptional regulator